MEAGLPTSISMFYNYSSSFFIFLEAPSTVTTPAPRQINVNEEPVIGSFVPTLLTTVILTAPSSTSVFKSVVDS